MDAAQEGECMRCNNCRYWIKREDENYDLDTPIQYRSCVNPKFVNHYEELPIDGLKYGDYLYTAKNFGCTHFEEKV